jgi:hypothetical protein
MQWRVAKVSQGAKVIGIIFEIDARRHRNRLESDSVDMVWESNRANREGGKNTACHPLDRNRLQKQVLEGLDKRKVKIRWIDWEEEMMGGKGPQPLEVWEDIHRTLHSLGQPKIENPEGVEDADTGWLHKIEHSIEITKLHVSQS